DGGPTTQRDRTRPRPCDLPAARHPDALARPACRALVDPALELGNRDQDRLRAAADDPQLGLDVLIEEIAAYPEHLRRLTRTDRKTPQSAARPCLRPRAPAVVGVEELERELLGLSRHSKARNLSATRALVNTRIDSSR